MRTLIDLLIGLAAGAVAVRAGWSGRPDLLEAGELEPWRAALSRVLALGAAGALIAFRPSALVSREGSTVLAGVALGVATALLGGGAGDAAWPWLLAGAALALGARRRMLAHSPELAASAPHGTESRPRASALALASLALLAAGVGEAMISIARVTGRTMPDWPADRVATASTLAALVVVGAFVFGRPISDVARSELAFRRGARSDELGLAWAGLVCVAASLAGWVVAYGVTSTRGLRGLTRRFDLDVSASGTLAFDVVVAAAAFVLPAFAVGAALYLVRSRSAWLAITAGIVAGVWRGSVLPPIESLALPASSEGTSLGAKLAAVIGSTGTAPSGAVVAALGGLLAAAATWRARRDRAAAGSIALASAATLALVLVVPARIGYTPKAFERFAVPPLAVAEGASGQLLVTPGGVGIERVSLDHRVVAPGVEQARCDRDQLACAHALLSAGARERGARVLLVGVLTPGRALALEGLGCASVDRSSGWWRDMGTLEAFLFRNAGERGEAVLPAKGEVVSPAVARRRAREGEYDLVVAPAVERNDPRARFLAAPPSTVQVAWLDPRDELGDAPSGERALLASGGAEAFAVGRVRNAEPPRDPTPGAPAWMPIEGGREVPSRLARLLEREEPRRRENERELARRLRAGAHDSPWRDLADGFSMHLEAQVESSPYESPAQRVELDREALDRLFAHATLGIPDLFTRTLFDGLAAVIRAKRDVELAYAIVEPLAELWSPWLEGMKTLAWADAEELDLAGAVARLEPHAETFAGEREFVLSYSGALRAVDRPRDAARALERLVASGVADRGVEKELARTWIECGDPESRRRAIDLLRELVRADPEDREAWGILAPRSLRAGEDG